MSNPLLLFLFEAREGKLPNAESVEEITHLSRTAFDGKKSTLRELRQGDSYYKRTTGTVGCRPYLVGVLIIKLTIILQREAQN